MYNTIKPWLVIGASSYVCVQLFLISPSTKWWVGKYTTPNCPSRLAASPTSYSAVPRLQELETLPRRLAVPLFTSSESTSSQLRQACLLDGVGCGNCRVEYSYNMLYFNKVARKNSISGSPSYTSPLECASPADSPPRNEFPAPDNRTLRKSSC